MKDGEQETRFSLIKDPNGDRPLTDKECPKLIARPLEDKDFWNSEDLPDWRLLKDFMSREGPITKPQMTKLLTKTLSVFKSEPNLVSIAEPVCIVGDIHGQYADLLNMISKAGDPGSLNYLFMGDYVDRGIFGIEVCTLLFSIKLSFPKSVVLLRGNHESRNMTETFTFREEVLNRFDIEIYDLFMEVFDAMPISAQISKKYLAMHGGISP